MFRTVVDVTDRQYSGGAHYEMARDKAAAEGYDAVWVADENDPGYREYGRRKLETVNVDELVVLLEGARNIVAAASNLLRKYAGFECLRALGLDAEDLHARTAYEAGCSRRAASQINFGMAYASMGHDSTPEQQLKARAAVFGARSASAGSGRSAGDRLRLAAKTAVTLLPMPTALRAQTSNGGSTSGRLTERSRRRRSRGGCQGPRWAVTTTDKYQNCRNR